MSLTSNDLQTLIEYVNRKDETVKKTLTEELFQVKDVITEEVRQRIFEEVKTNPEFRGPIGYTGHDGDQGPQGPKGPRGNAPKIEIDEENVRVRFQVDSALTESTGAEIPIWSKWIDLKGAKGELGEQGPQGPSGDHGRDGKSFVKASIYEGSLYLYDDSGEQYDLGRVIGEQGPPGPQGPKGEPMTWHDLTEAQRELLVGPIGEQGPKGDPGKFPMVECDHENRKIRFQIREDYTNPWGEWIDMPVGPQGDKGDQGLPFVYENFTPEQLNELVGPQGPQGLQGPKGDKGDKGDTGERGPKGAKGDKGDQGEVGPRGPKGKDADVKPVQEEVENFKKKVIEEHTKFDKKLKDTTEKLRNEMSKSVSSVKFNRLNELLIPTAAFSVAGDPTGQLVVEEVTGFTNWNDVIDGAPVYIDNQIKAALRGDTYDPDNYIIYADASDIEDTADALIFKGERRGSVYLYRVGRMTIDPRVNADGPTLAPGEYYYLAHPTPGINYGQITANKPTYGVAQLIGQAVSTTELFVNTTVDPVILDRTNAKIQGRNGALAAVPATPVGDSQDVFGDIVYDGTHVYMCIANYDGVTNIWKRIAFDATWS